MKEPFLVPIKRIIFKFDGPSRSLINLFLCHILGWPSIASAGTAHPPQATQGQQMDLTQIEPDSGSLLRNRKKERNKSIDYPPRNNPMSINECDPDRAHKSALSAVLQCDPNEMGKYTFVPNTIIWFKSTHSIHPFSSYMYIYSIKDKGVSLVSLYFKMMSWI